MLLLISGKGDPEDLVGRSRRPPTNSKWLDEGPGPVAAKPRAEPNRRGSGAAYLSICVESVKVGEGGSARKATSATWPAIPRPRSRQRQTIRQRTVDDPDSDGIGSVKYRCREGAQVVALRAERLGRRGGPVARRRQDPKRLTFVVLGDNKILWHPTPWTRRKRAGMLCGRDGRQYLELRVMCTGANARRSGWGRAVAAANRRQRRSRHAAAGCGPANEVPGGIGSFEAIAVSTDGKFALTTLNKSMILWDLETRRKIREFPHEGRVNSVAFSADGKRAFSGSGESQFVEKGQPFKQVDCTVRVWDVESGEELQRLEGHKEHVTGLAVSADGTRIVSSGRRDMVRLWDIGTKKSQRQLATSDPRFGSPKVAISPDGKVLIACEFNTVCAAQMPTGKPLWRQSGHTSGINALAMSADGRFAASGGGGTKTENGERIAVGTAILLWDVKAGRPLGQFAGHNSSVHTLAFSKDGKYLVSGAGMT